MIAELLMGSQPAVAEFAQKSKAEQLTFTGWQTDGWVRWLAGLRGTYERRMNRMCDILEAGRYQLKQGTPVKSTESDWAVISKTKMYSFDWPRGGMFIWLQVHFDAHPLFGKVDEATLAQSLWVYLTTKPFLVLAAPGATFSPNAEILAEKGWKFFRLCFAAVDEEDIERCSHGFADGVKAFWQIKDKKDLPSVDDDSMPEDGLMDLGMNMAC